MTNDPRIKALAQEASAKIKQVSEGREREIEQIYKDFRAKADAIQAEASTKSLPGSGADLLPHTERARDFSIMPKISTSVHTLGYYVPTLPNHIEDELGSHFENLSKTEQYTLLVVLAGYMASVAGCEDDEDKCLHDIYNDVSRDLPSPIADRLSEIKELERLSNGTILALMEALVLNIHYTHVEEE